MSFLSLRGAALLAAFALAAPAAFAQTTTSTDQQPAMGNGNMGRMGNRQAEMMKELNLTADQQTKVQALMREQRASMANMPRPAGGEMSEADRQAMQTRRAEMDTKMKEILTPEQYTKYQAMRPQRQRPQAN